MAQVAETPRIDATDLTGVAETLLIPLYSRAQESRRPGAILHDAKAAELVAQLDCDFSRFAQSPFDQFTTTLRTRQFDCLAQAFLAQHPTGTVVEIGCGLDTRFHRIDESPTGASGGRATWFELDQPAVIALRRRLLGELPRCQLIASSALDFAWLDVVAAAAGPYLFLAEGVLVYFHEADVRRLVLALRDRFPDAELVADSTSPLLAWLHRFDPKMGAVARQIHWTLRHGRDVERWGDGIRLLSAWYYFDAPEPRLGATRLMRFFPPFGRGAGIYHYRLGSTGQQRT
jgi:O-methyltransferase involved in polyketide biosynthesis